METEILKDKALENIEENMKLRAELKGQEGAMRALKIMEENDKLLAESLNDSVLIHKNFGYYGYDYMNDYSDSKD